jgi:hypothetical protein
MAAQSIPPPDLPKTAIFRRLIDIDDVTGEFTFHDNFKLKIPLQEYGNSYIRFNSGTKNITVESMSKLISDTNLALTGKRLGPAAVEIMCEKENENEQIYMMFELNTKLKAPPRNVNLEEFEDVVEATRDVEQGTALCKTRGEPLPEVLGPNPNELVQVTDEVIKLIVTGKVTVNGKLSEYEFQLYGVIGEFSFKIKLLEYHHPDYAMSGDKIPERFTVGSMLPAYSKNLFFFEAKHGPLVYMLKADYDALSKAVSPKIKSGGGRRRKTRKAIKKKKSRKGSILSSKRKLHVSRTRKYRRARRSRK